ncbi:hypothetical protein DH2020_002846 [Rehmannia glutinosa]|uniref:MADS-box protein n=1 Tax=Rehmannia glutinosa TaxID=99300 RepID=A0ABR0XVB0_REHGL
MGRGKIEIEKIENKNARQVTFSKRRAGLFKKAHELAVLCEADVAVIIFSCTGKMFEFSSTDMKTILERYNKCLESKQSPAVQVQPKPENQKQEPDENEFLKQEIERLKSKQRQLLGKDLIGMDLQELHEVERQLQEGLLCVKTRKGERLMDDNVIWRKQAPNFKKEDTGR